MKWLPRRTLRAGLVAAVAASAGCAASAHRDRDRPTLLPPVAQRAAPTTTPSGRPSPEVVRVSAAEPVMPSADAPAPGVPPTLSADEAVRFALENNPTLHAAREQRGFAQGGVVIARTYPFNPTYTGQLLSATGPGVTNHTTQAHQVTLEVEVFGQRRIRQQAAAAVLSRTEWEIATQELTVAVAAARAFNGVLYQRRKLGVLDDTVRLNAQVVEQVKKLVDLNRLRPADLILARTELDAARAQLGQGRAAVATARAELRRQLGTLDDSFALTGELDVPVPPLDPGGLAEAALAGRPDVQSRRLAVDEADARARLQAADRFGNLTAGPVYNSNESSVQFYGVQFGGPLPVLNRKAGELMQARATLARAAADVRQAEVQAAQDVQAAVLRLAAARKWADRYTTEVLPNLTAAVADMGKLLDQNDPGVDALKVIGVQRNYLTATSAYLDAVYELSQARVDLAAAVGDPALACGGCAPAALPQVVPPPKPLPLSPEKPAPPKDAR